MKLAARLIARVSRRAPDLVIPKTGEPYLHRWWLLPKNPVFNVYLHQFLRGDDDRALHDHPWLFNASLLLQGGYIEHTIRAGGIEVKRRMDAGSLKVRFGPSPHRIELLSEPVALHQDGSVTGGLLPCWTLFITGPEIRPWGFHCAKGWVLSTRFGKKGCDQ